MPQRLIALSEVSSASRFYRAISTAPSQGTALLTIQDGLAEINLTTQNLRRLEPVPEHEYNFVSGPAKNSVYVAWLASKRNGTIFLGSFNAANHALGSFYYIFDSRNINHSGLRLDNFEWLIVTAAPSPRSYVWPDQIDSATIFGNLFGSERIKNASSSPLELFDPGNKKEQIDDLDGDDFFDEDEYESDESVKDVLEHEQEEVPLSSPRPSYKHKKLRKKLSRATEELANENSASFDDEEEMLREEEDYLLLEEPAEDEEPRI